MVLVGVLARLAYRLSRHRVLHLPGDLAVVLLALGLAAYTLLRVLLAGAWALPPALIAGLGLWSVLSVGLRLRSFVVFRPRSAPPPAGRSLTPFKPVAVRASGLFEVGGQRRWFVEARGEIQATELGERVIMIRVQPVRLLGLFPAAEEEWGCWYIIVRPEALRAVAGGHLHFGLRPRPALRLTHSESGRPPSYLSFGDTQAWEQVAADLRQVFSS